MVVAPDGRIFVTEKFGSVRIVENEELLTTPFVTVGVSATGDRGLLGITLDPNFEENQFVYLYYTTSDAEFNKVERFTADGNLAENNSDTTILELSELGEGDWHNGGAMRFGNDGKLYVATGEASMGSAVSQDLNSYHGKLLRINPDGSIPEGNPFQDGSEIKQRIWSYGLRNPYTMDINSETGQIFVNDVGTAVWEEINDATEAGKNFGYSDVEGFSDNENYDDPFYAYRHTEEITDSTGNAITGGVFFDGSNTNYPSEYHNRYFFQNFGSISRGWINYIDSENPNSRETFATEIFGTTSIVQGPEGNLHYSSTPGGSLYKIIYYPDPEPIILESPNDIVAFLDDEVEFSVSVAGQNPISYEWYKDGELLAGPAFQSNTVSIAEIKYYRAGEYYIIASNDYGSVTSDEFTIEVLEPNDPPEPTIQTLSQSNYSGGDIIVIEGSAVDTEDGIIDDSQLEWSIDFHHADHVHEAVEIFKEVSTIEFEPPIIGETSTDVFYRIYLKATDNVGQETETYVDINPNISQVTLTTDPEGFPVQLDGKNVETPYTFDAVAGMQRQINVDKYVYTEEQDYTFDKWILNTDWLSNDSSQQILIPNESTEYTALYLEGITVTANNNEVIDHVKIAYSTTEDLYLIEWKDNKSLVKLQIFNLNGHQIHSSNFKNNTKIDLSKYNAGLYIVHMYSQGLNYRSKLYNFK
jgi:glucose/arabinose dehydrogenase